MTTSEAETTIVFDYPEERVYFFTTRRGERDNLIKRIGDKNILSIRDNRGESWKITAKIAAFRNAYMVSSVHSGVSTEKL